MTRDPAERSNDTGASAQSATHDGLCPRVGLAELVVTSYAGVALATVIDLVHATLAPGTRVTATAFLTASFHLLAMLLPLAPLIALLLWALLWLVRRVPWLTPVRMRLRLGRRFFVHDRSGFAGGMAVVAFATTVIVAASRAYTVFGTTFHRADLAAAAFGLATGGILAFAAVVAAVVAVVARAIARWLGPLASTAVVVVAAIGLTAAAVTWTLTTYPELVTTYGAARLSSPAVLAGAVVLCALATRLIVRRARPRLPRAALVLTIGSLAALLVTALTYDRSQRARSVVEQRAISGTAALRLWARLTDLDGDGFSRAFGGGDCDDRNPSVHPGAADHPGDGVDADCFGGDGTPLVTALGDGRFSRRPLPLSTPNFLVITIDALRPDAIDPSRSPRMARLRDESVSFPATVAHSSRSIRSIPAMWTGLYPSQIAYGTEFQFPALLDENVTVAEQLGDAGYARVAVIGTNYFTRSHGFLQGFERDHQDFEYQPPPALVTDRAIGELQRLDSEARPWLLWVHLFNVHAPHRNATHAPEAENPYADAYAQEVNFADTQVGRLLDTVESLGAGARTVVVLASDHGEAYGEHGVFGHSTTLYEPEVAATLAVRVPGVEPHVVRAPVALMDVAPTLLELAGSRMPVPTPSESLWPLMTREREPDLERPILAELLPDGHYQWDIKSIRRGDAKLIWWVREGRYQLFDLARDPLEQEDLADERREEARELFGLLRAWSAVAVRTEHQREAILAAHRLDAPPAMSNPLDLRIAGVGRLLGFDLPRTRFSPGEVIPLELYWQAEHDTDRDLYIEIGAFWPPGSPRGPGAFHGSHYPIFAQYHTDDWRPGEILRDPVRLVVPPELFSGPVRFDLWITENGAPISFALDGQEQQRMTLFEIVVE